MAQYLTTFFQTSFNMKKLLSLLLILTALASVSIYAQENMPTLPVDPDTKLITYKEVVTVTGKPDELFNRTVEWINKQYKNPAEATKVRDAASGIIEIIHRFELVRDEKGISRPAGIVDYSLKLEMKDGRYRYTITNFNYKNVSRQPIELWLDKKNPAYNPQFEEYLKQVDAFTQKLITSLKQGMLPPAPKKTDEW